jgi:hypothetical protein
MKKITLLFAAFLMVAICVNAVPLNNPKDASGYYIVKWNCEKDTWATSNDFEVDEAFTFAVDITGTPLEDWLRLPATNAGATRGIAINRWSGFGDFLDDINRLKQIKGNIFGVTWCLAQAGRSFNPDLAMIPGTVTYFKMEVFGFEYSAEHTGLAWYVNAIRIDEIDGNAFTSAPYTGTKTSVMFYCDDYKGFWPYTVGGYAPTCTVVDKASGILPVNVDSQIIGYEYYNLQGIKLSKQPESGLFIEKAIKANGTSVASKVLKPLK